MQVLGVELMKGTSKAGRAYEMARLHTMARLAPGMGEGFAKGMMGVQFECADADVARRIEKLSYPAVMEVDVQTVMRFGKAEQMVFDAKPVDAAK